MIHILTCFYRRPQITRLYIAGIKRLIEESAISFSGTFVASEPDDLKLLREIAPKGFGNYTVDISQELRKQAKAMHRDEVYTAFVRGQHEMNKYSTAVEWGDQETYNSCILSPVDYYNQTFNTND